MITPQTIWMLALGVTLLAGWVDFRTRKIPNWLTVPALILGIGVRILAAGWPGAKASLEGAGRGLVLLLPFVLCRGLGGADRQAVGGGGALLGSLRFLVSRLRRIVVAVSR